MKNPHNFSLGTIVLAYFPYSERLQVKLRPALIISILPHNSFLVAFITSQISGVTEFDCKINPDQNNNLTRDSVIRTNRLTVISLEMITRRLGNLSPAKNYEISDKLILLAKSYQKASLAAS